MANDEFETAEPTVPFAHLLNSILQAVLLVLGPTYLFVEVFDYPLMENLPVYGGVFGLGVVLVSVAHIHKGKTIFSIFSSARADAVNAQAISAVDKKQRKEILAQRRVEQNAVNASEAFAQAQMNNSILFLIVCGLMSGFVKNYRPDFALAMTVLPAAAFLLTRTRKAGVLA